MDNKKLMQILLRDVSELQELIAVIRNTGQIDPFEAELLHTRISGVRHMLEVVSGSETLHKKAEPERLISEEKTEAAPEKTVGKMNADEAPLKEEVHSRMEESVEFQSIPIANVIRHIPEEKPEVPEIPEKLPEIKGAAVTKESIPAEEKVPSPPEDKVVPKPEKPFPSVEKAGESDEMELEEEDSLAGRQTLGEKFSHGKSVNDLLLEQGRPDSKFTNMPVSSLQSAIGINDRFLFTRELFEGNADVFSETVKKIDAMSNLHDAATYLRENFKWKKNDTSLKFIDLIKRRFL